MKSHYQYIPLLSIMIGFIILSSCEKVEVATADADVAVVEAYLHPDHEILIHITHQLVYQSSDTLIKPVEGLTITVTSPDTMVVCIADSAGYYRAPIIPLEGLVYNMEFTYNQGTVSASTSIPLKPSNYEASGTSIIVGTIGGEPGSGDPPTQPTPLTLTWDNDDLSYFMVVTENIETNPEPIFDTAEVIPFRVFRNTPDRTNTQDLNPGSFYYLGHHRIILYHLNPEYAQLYDDNGSSSLNLAKPPSNIINGLGVFTGINSDTLFVLVKEE
ncbi:MAG TPA: hypothetical protein DEO70_05675 [Bacteroidales bacterium]|nr:MAG: hypothetical protein A2X11_16985 [Bacteroidetes bacterium GWE2_42_24]OFY25179.1 MAG: hypothetical protein A2X09_05150 [Bacteroidetes bacterium GWF2_43_11]HBZ66309.1 hypothetical protein [Bacteroidales bacterium]